MDNISPNKSCDICTKVPLSVFKIILYIIITTVITILVIGYHMKNVWKSNWEDHKCDIFAMPFANYIDPNVSTIDNFNECIKKKTDPMIKAYTKRQFDIKVLNSKRNEERLKKEMEESSKSVEETKSTLNTILENIKDSYSRIKIIFQYVSHKIQNFFYKLGAIIWSIYYLMIAQINTVMIQISRIYQTITILSLFIILITAVSFAYPLLLPISAIMTAIIIELKLADAAARKRAYCCFSPNTKIDLDNSKIEIQNIKLNDVLIDNNIVTGIVIDTNIDKGIPLRKLDNNLFVTDDHIYYNNENNKWNYVVDIFDNKNINYSNTVYCLVTSKNVIHSNSNIFRDYEEVSSREIQSDISSLILKSLGNKDPKIISQYELGEKTNCLPENSKIKIKNDLYKEIKDIKIGDKISTGIVTGKYICNTEYIEWFQINNTHISPRIIVYDQIKKEYNKVYNLGKLNTDYKCNIGYHLIVDNSEIELENDIIVRDFVETYDKEVQNIISDKVINFLNKN